MRVVDHAFGCSKGQFRIIESSSINDLSFAVDIDLVCCALHNIIERWTCPYDQSLLISPAAYQNLHQVRNVLVNNQACRWTRLTSLQSFCTLHPVHALRTERTQEHAKAKIYLYVPPVITHNLPVHIYI